MDCTKAQETILETFVFPLTDKQHAQLAEHVAVCIPCRNFQQLQVGIDGRLTAALPGGSLSPECYALVYEKIGCDPLFAWPHFLPDLAHLIGCVTGVMLSLAFLPWDSRTILLTGLAFTGLTYFLQVVVRSYVERSADS